MDGIVSGANFAISALARGFLHCEVWQRPDLSRSEGARLATEIAAHLERIGPSYKGLLFDCRRATPVWGPETHRAIVSFLAPWERRRQPLVVLTSDEPIQQLTLRELVSTTAPRHGVVVEDWEAALAEIERVHRVPSR